MVFVAVEAFCDGGCRRLHEEEGYDSESGGRITCGGKAAGQTSDDNVGHKHDDSLEDVSDLIRIDSATSQQLTEVIKSSRRPRRSTSKAAVTDQIKFQTCKQAEIRVWSSTEVMPTLFRMILR